MVGIALDGDDVLGNAVVRMGRHAAGAEYEVARAGGERDRPLVGVGMAVELGLTVTRTSPAGQITVMLVSSGMPVTSLGPAAVISTVRPIMRPVSLFHFGS